MSLSVDIPRINITPDAEEDDDHIAMNFSEALTDVEDLYESDNERRTVVVKRKSKLKIKLIEDGEVSELEDFEGSSDDEETRIVEHPEPVTFNDLDLEAPITEESYKKHTKGGKGKGKMKTEFASKQKSFYQSMSEEENASDAGIITNSESYDTENEINEADIPETEINLDLYKTDHLMADDLASELSDNSDNDRSHENSVTSAPKFSNTLTITPNYDNALTDVEVLHSDSDSEVETKKSKSRRTKHRVQKKPISTDLEDLYLSDDKTVRKSVRKPKRRTKILCAKSHSLPFDSENEDNAKLPFPLCKEIAKKNCVSLRIPDFDTNLLTEVEDIESDNDLERVESLYTDEVALEDMLKRMTLGYGHVNEKNSNYQKDKQSQAVIQTNTNIEPDKETTDEDEIQADDAEEKDISIKEDSIAYKIKFSPSNHNLKLNTGETSSNLILPANSEDPLTDCENVDSSSEETDYKKIPIACVQQHYLTDHEEFSDDDISTEGTIQEIPLPLPTRNLVLIQENDSLVPTVRILPLDNMNNDNEDSSQDLEQATDEESISEAEEALNLLNVEQPVRAATPDLPMLEGGQVNVTENMNKLAYCNSPALIESVTDTEEVLVDKKHKRKRAPKFKYLHEKSLENRKNLIAPTNDKKSLHADTEDICLSDNLKDGNCANANMPLIVPRNTSLVLTDTENIDLSGDEQECRTFSATPEHMKAMGGETLFLKEGSGPFSIIDKLELNRFTLGAGNTFLTPATTDSEDMMISAEEDIESSSPNYIHQDQDIADALDASEEVMYLKGGGYTEQHTDDEYLNKDLKNLVDFIRKDDASFQTESITLDFKNCFVAFGFTEWDASRKPAEVTDQSALRQAAAQQGDDGTQPSTSVAGTFSAKAESEEVHDRTDKDKSKKVSDQHQLSDDMKQLLKEMEKESKQ